MQNTKPWSRLWFIFLSILFHDCSVNELLIINHPSYSIGIVDNYAPPSSAYVAFSYSSGYSRTTGYTNGYHGWNVPSSNVHIKDKFMVQYDSLDPQTARMLFSYPVKDSTDYKNDIALFKKNPPGYLSP